MRRAGILTSVGVLALFALIQLVRPTTTNPSVDPNRTLQAQVGASHPAVSVIARACQDCHSHQTTWPWYSRVAPVSWLVAHDVADARTAVNFSTWANYGVEQQRKMLRESCEAVTEREMPLSMYVWVHSEAKLRLPDIRAICDLAQMN